MAAAKKAALKHENDKQETPSTKKTTPAILSHVVPTAAEVAAAKARKAGMDTQAIYVLISTRRTYIYIYIYIYIYGYTIYI